MPDDLTSALDQIRTDIEDTVAVYNLDGPGKNSYPISAAMSLHARSLLAAIERVLKAHAPVPDPGHAPRCRAECDTDLDGSHRDDGGHCCHDSPCPTVGAITEALTGPRPGEGEGGDGT